MAIENREYQVNAVDAVRRHWANGVKSVCLVSPTGSGKTHMGSMLIGSARTLWVAHRTELVQQARDHLRRTGVRDVGIIMPGYSRETNARIQVGTIQTMLRRDIEFDPELIVLDECQHYVADEFRKIVEAFPNAPILGLTATPERQDGRPLGDIHDALVVAAQPSELLRLGHIVPVDVRRPVSDLGSDIFMDAVDAWMQFADGGQTFAFYSRVELARKEAGRFRARGVRAALIEGQMGRRLRNDDIAMFRGGTVRVLTSVQTLTEGVDVPEASVALSCRPFQHASGMIQAFGRVLRPFPGKERALCIDMTGATHRLGLPTDDRQYSLTGRAISLSQPSGDPPAVSGRPEFEQGIVPTPAEMVSSDGPRTGDISTLFQPPAILLSAAKLEKIRKRRGAKAAAEAAALWERQV